MATSDPKTMAVKCPKCGAHFDVGIALAGQLARCRCQYVFPLPAAKSAPPPQSQYIGISCRLCGTRMFGTPDQVGRALKCLDCGAATVLKPPEPEKPLRTPAALEGEQYEVWGVDEAPPVSQLLATQPTYVPIVCRRCGTLMHATADQVGQTVRCPDCRAEHVVPRPEKRKRRSVVARDSPRLDPAAAPGERPPVVPIETRGMLYEQEEEAERARRLARGYRGPKVDARGRPVLPRWPLVSGVWRMLATQEIIARWVLLSIVFGFAAQLLGEALLTPIQGVAEAVKLVFAVLGGIVACGWLAMAAPLIVAIVCDSAIGEDELRQPPKLLAFDWWGELFSFVNSAALAGIGSWGAWHLAQLASLGDVAAAGIATAVILFVTPVAMLSTALEGSPFDVLSPRVLRSFGHCAGAWMLFYTQTAMLAGVVAGAAALSAQWLGPFSGRSTITAWAVAPMVVAGLLVFARLLGRLGWVLTERMPGDQRETPTDSRD